jgi:hypothetical protein
MKELSRGNGGGAYSRGDGKVSSSKRPDLEITSELSEGKGECRDTYRPSSGYMRNWNQYSKLETMVGRPTRRCACDSFGGSFEREASASFETDERPDDVAVFISDKRPDGVAAFISDDGEVDPT